MYYLDQPTDLFERFFTPEVAPRRVTFKKNDNGYNYLVPVPGLKKKDVTVTVENGVCRIRCEKSPVVGKFTTEFNIPKDGDINRIEARVEDGLLYVDVPLTETSKARLIEIR